MAKRNNPRPAAAPRLPKAPWVIAALVAAAFALYWGSLRNPPVYDDVGLSIQVLRSYAASLFNLDLRWFSYVTFGWIYEAFGRDWFWQRVVNVLLHSVVASILFLFLRRLFAAVLPAERQPVDPAWWAFFGALLFLLHPVAVYAVAYLVQRSIVMATLFGLVSLHCFLEGLIRESRRWYFAAAAAYFVAVFSKEHAVMLPAVAVALALLVRGPKRGGLQGFALPLVVFAAIGAAVVLKSRGLLGVPYEHFVGDAMRQLAESRSNELSGTQIPAPADRYPLSVVNQGFLFFRYLLTWLAPIPGWMSIDVRPDFPTQLLSWPQSAGFLAWLAWPWLGLLLLLKGGRAGLAGFAMLAPWLLALTEVASVRIQEMFVLYRSYLWMCLLPAALPAIVGRLPARWGLAVLCVASLALVPAFRDRLASFSSNITLWEDAVRKNAGLKTPLVERTWRNRGMAYHQAGRYEEARADFERALALDPQSAESWMARGTLFMRIAQSERSAADFDRALQLDPLHATALARRCVVRMRLKRLEEAFADCTRAAQFEPRNPDSFTSLGMVHALRGEIALAEQQYRHALALEPEDRDAHYQFAVLLRGSGRGAEALDHFAVACRGGVQRACESAR